jgi:DNA-binding IclR family transcriptional regulator
MTARETDRKGIQSVEVAGALLRVLADLRAPVALTELAGRAGMTPSKAHRYLISLCRIGLVEQDAETLKYSAGDLSLGLGLAALGRIDVVRVASAAMAALRDRIDETVALAVWGNRGPVVVRFEESAQPVTVNVRVGSVLPVTTTAFGRVFAAWPRSAAVAELVEAELAAIADPAERDAARAEFEAAVDRVRDRGQARIQGLLLPGVSVLAAPLFDHSGQLAGALATVGHQAAMDVRWSGPVSAALGETAERVSAALGAPAAAVAGDATG